MADPAQQPNLFQPEGIMHAVANAAPAHQNRKLVIAAKVILAVAITAILAATAIFCIAAPLTALAGLVIWQKIGLITIGAISGAMALATPFVAHHNKLHQDNPGENLKNVGNFLKTTIVNTLKAAAVATVVFSIFGIYSFQFNLTQEKLIQS